MPFFSIVSVPASQREDEIKRLKEAGPGKVSVEGMTLLPNGFLAVSLSHANRRGELFGYTTIVISPKSEGFSLDA